MAITLSHVAKLENNPLRKGILMNLLRYSTVLNDLPFENVDSLTSVAVRWTNLPTAGFRRINEGYTPDEGDVEQVWESVYGFGGEIKFDRVFEKIGNTIVDPKVNQVNMKTKAMSLVFNDYFINGDHGTDPDGFEGLKKRVGNMPSRQTIYAAGSSSAPLDPVSSAANARTFITKMEEGLYKTNGGSVDAIYCNEGVKWGLGRILRLAQASGGMLDVTRDTWGRTYPVYNGAVVRDIGLKRDQSTEIITNAETAGDAGTDSTSMYFVSFDMDQGIMGIQLGPMEIYDPLNGGEQESTPTKLVRIDWFCGLAGFGSYGVSRLRNFERPADWTE